MATGTQKIIGFTMATQRPLNEYYLNEAVAWVDSAAALDGIPLGSRSDGMLVKIGTVLYWFKADLTTLEAVPVAATNTAANVAIVDSGDLYTAIDVEAALAEVMAKANATNVTIAGLGSGVLQTVFAIVFETTDRSVAARISGTTTKPTGWVLAANSTVNLLITHTLTGRKLAGCNVFEIDGANERLLPAFSSAYSGILCNGLTVLIEGLAPTDLAIRIELLFD